MYKASEGRSTDGGLTLRLQSRVKGLCTALRKKIPSSVSFNSLEFFMKCRHFFLQQCRNCKASNTGFNLRTSSSIRGEKSKPELHEVLFPSSRVLARDFTRYPLSEELARGLHTLQQLLINKCCSCISTNVEHCIMASWSWTTLSENRNGLHSVQQEWQWNQERQQKWVCVLSNSIAFISLPSIFQMLANFLGV